MIVWKICWVETWKKKNDINEEIKEVDIAKSPAHSSKAEQEKSKLNTTKEDNDKYCFSLSMACNPPCPSYKLTNSVHLLNCPTLFVTYPNNQAQVHSNTIFTINFHLLKSPQFELPSLIYGKYQSLSSKHQSCAWLLNQGKLYLIN